MNWKRRSRGRGKVHETADDFRGKGRLFCLRDLRAGHAAVLFRNPVCGKFKPSQSGAAILGEDGASERCGGRRAAGGPAAERGGGYVGAGGSGGSAGRFRGSSSATARALAMPEAQLMLKKEYRVP